MTLLILAAVLLTPAALLALSGPGEIELSTKPKNLGVFGAELSTRAHMVVATVEDISSAAENSSFAASSVTNHTARIPAGMRVGVDA
jgi:hypothetical protein